MKTHPRVNGDETVDPLFQRYQEKIVMDYDKLRKVAEGFQALGRKVVVTIGSWDGLHIGQVRYLIRSRAAGDLLIAAYDTDRAIKSYKGPSRPIVPEIERAEMLSYTPGVDFVTCIDDVNDKGEWQYELLKVVKPDIFVAVVDSYPESQLNDIRSYGLEVIVLPRQADTSTSAVIARLVKEKILQMADGVADAITSKR